MPFLCASKSTIDTHCRYDRALGDTTRGFLKIITGTASLDVEFSQFLTCPAVRGRQHQALVGRLEWNLDEL